MPTLPTTMPAAMLARRAASSAVAPAPSAAASTATTVSPAPETSNTSRASAASLCTAPDGVHQQHAFLAQRDQDRAELEIVDEGARRGGDLVLAADRQLGGSAELAAIGLQEAGAAIGGIVEALGIDHHEMAGAARRHDRRRGDALVEDALGIVREDGDVAGRRRVLDQPQQILAHRRRDRRHLLAVGAQELLRAGDVAGLDRGGATALDEEMHLAVLRLRGKPAHLAAGGVVPHHRDEAGLQARDPGDCAARCRRRRGYGSPAPPAAPGSAPPATAAPRRRRRNDRA